MSRTSPRTHARRPGPSDLAARMGYLLILTLAIAIVAGCGGGSGPTPSPTFGVAPTPGPTATPWPTNVLEGVLAMGAADAEIWKGGADIARAADARDPEAMWGAADGLAKLLEELSPNIDVLEAYPHTAALGAAYRASFPVMLEGAIQIRDSITAGDAAGVIAGSKRLAVGVTLYAEVRAMLESYVNEAVTMKRNLVQ